MATYMRTRHKKIKKFQSTEYKHFGALRLITIIILGLLLFGFGLVSFFLYQRIYISIEQAQIFVNTQSGLGVEPINFKRYEEVEKKWETKYNTIVGEIVRDPFNPINIIPEVVEESDE
jgi:hypothetical protein